MPLRRAAAVLLLAAPVVAAQTPSEPRLLLSAFGGYRGGTVLWRVTGQPLAVFVSIADTLVVQPGAYDTLNLSRRVVPGLVVGASGTYFPNPHLGFQAEIAFLGMSTESDCVIRQSQPPTINDIDPELCSSLAGQSVATSAVGFSVGLVGRLAPNRPTYPYILANAGLVARTRSTIEMQAFFHSSNNNLEPATVVLDPSPMNSAAHFSVGAGVAMSLGPGYQLRFEGRDIIAELDRVTGLGNPNESTTGSLSPPHSGHFYHNLTFTVGLDVVFEKRRGRRY